MSGFKFMGEQEDPEFDVIEARGNVRIYDGTDAKRDEFSCPCCGVPNDSSWCDECVRGECGERDPATFNRDGCLAKKARGQ